jgi:hypothetical protein
MGKHTKIGVLSFFSTFGTLDITEDQLVNGKPDGVHVTFEELDKLGLDFNSNNGQGLLYNTPNPDECTFVVYGPFRIYRITFETALIVKPQISKSC